MQGVNAGQACRERVQHSQRSPESLERERSYLKLLEVIEGKRKTFLGS